MVRDIPTGEVMAMKQLDLTLELEEKPKVLPDITRNRHRGNKQSEKANTSIHPRKPSLREIIFAYLLCMFPAGRTCEQLSVELGIRYTTVSGRLSELKAEGRVKVNGERQTDTGSPADIICAVRPL